ncbi:hypothetical protein CMI42_04005 [Candidatus Pacearchaeota archaeon]|nr:hypothetical protein [Candidatus Pacearchaeota archaeon]|tara:strand:+ start:1564 stop:1770 length:207 start_codon:yes stop_codon:yes gene_type:complete
MEAETITISKEKFDEMNKELSELKEKLKGDFSETVGSEDETTVEEDDLLRQVKASLEDLKHGRIRRVA